MRYCSIVHVVGCLFFLLSLGCESDQRPPSDKIALDEEAVESSETSIASEPNSLETTGDENGEDSSVDASTDEPAAVPAYTEEEIADAEAVIAEKGIAIRDAGGAVVALDMAKRRAWVDDAEALQVLVYPETLTSLILEGPNVTNAVIPKIVESTNLVSLTLSNTMVDDAGLEQASALPKLRMINLRTATAITDQSMATLAKIPTLVDVRLVDCAISDEGLAALLESPSLRAIDVRNCSGLSKEGFQTLVEKRPDLSVLKIGGTAVDNDVLSVVARLRELKGLVVEDAYVDDQAFAPLAGLPLTELTISRCPFLTSEGLSVLGELNDVSRLTLSGMYGVGDALAGISNPEKIVALNLAGLDLTDPQAAPLAAMTNLETLILNETQVTDAVVEYVEPLRSLKLLAVEQTQMSDSGVERIQAAVPECVIEKGLSY